MRDRQTCIGCGKQSPETDTNYTLISSQFGWRLTRYQDAGGATVVEWRCPDCWREYKAKRGMPIVTAPPSSRRDSAPVSDEAPTIPRMPSAPDLSERVSSKPAPPTRPTGRPR